MDAKRQLETQVALHQKTKELLNAAELELNTLRLQQGGGDARHSLSTPSTPIMRGTHSGRTESICNYSSVRLKWSSNHLTLFGGYVIVAFCEVNAYTDHFCASLSYWKFMRQ